MRFFSLSTSVAGSRQHSIDARPPRVARAFVQGRLVRLCLVAVPGGEHPAAGA